MSTDADPVGSVVTSAGNALSSLADESGDGAAWALELDAPQSSVDEEAGGLQGYGLFSILTVVVLGLAVLFVGDDLVVRNRPHHHAIAIILAAGVVLALVLVACAAWRTLGQPGARVRLNLRRTPTPAPAGEASLTTALVTQLVKQMAAPTPGQSSPSGSSATASPPAAVGAAAAATNGGQGDAPDKEAAASKNPVAREPVLIGSALLAAGTLAIGFAANLGGEEVAAISSGAAGLIAILLRQQVTPLADPKDAQNHPLSR
jgi:hypothetical protein